jgi:hypothetical protein
MPPPLFRRIRPRGGIGGRITPDGVCRAVKAAITRYHVSTDADEARARRLASGVLGALRQGRICRCGKGSRRAGHMIKRYGEQADQLKTAPHQLKGVGL